MRARKVFFQSRLVATLLPLIDAVGTLQDERIVAVLTENEPYRNACAVFFFA